MNQGSKGVTEFLSGIYATIGKGLELRQNKSFKSKYQKLTIHGPTGMIVVKHNFYVFIMLIWIFCAIVAIQFWMFLKGHLDPTIKVQHRSVLVQLSIIV